MRHEALIIRGRIKWFEVLLRIGIAATFFGHGVLALAGNPKWIPLLTAFGFSDFNAAYLLPVIGGIDVLVALALLFRPIRLVILWAMIWAFMAALSRPISGLPLWEFIERASNWALPLALLWIK
ncbi:MAG: hypothetical protein AB1458_10705, partial [Bacteroidota bacterium]